MGKSKTNKQNRLKIRVFLDPLLGEPVVAPRIPVAFVISVVFVISANPALGSLFAAV